ncbi:hypothetical protein B0T10DRAFT_545129 [Thelonectria olida]|uniref:Uncharacterized protein n=1 Tax=Thelonectria olida TaxID=1576542 RepID=A0A9P8WCP9_9HYPO|nr:hypothetical protein B0T10DRAFT_545129 [Thelonectria olida]
MCQDFSLRDPSGYSSPNNISVEHCACLRHPNNIPTNTNQKSSNTRCVYLPTSPTTCHQVWTRQLSPQFQLVRYTDGLQPLPANVHNLGTLNHAKQNVMNLRLRLCANREVLDLQNEKGTLSCSCYEVAPVVYVPNNVWLGQSFEMASRDKMENTADSVDAKEPVIHHFPHSNNACLKTKKTWLFARPKRAGPLAIRLVHLNLHSCCPLDQQGTQRKIHRDPVTIPSPKELTSISCRLALHIPHHHAPSPRLAALIRRHCTLPPAVGLPPDLTPGPSPNWDSTARSSDGWTHRQAQSISSISWAWKRGDEKKASSSPPNPRQMTSLTYVPRTKYRTQRHVKHASSLTPPRPPLGRPTASANGVCESPSSVSPGSPIQGQCQHAARGGHLNTHVPEQVGRVASAGQRLQGSPNVRAVATTNNLARARPIDGGLGFFAMPKLGIDVTRLSAKKCHPGFIDIHNTAL